MRQVPLIVGNGRLAHHFRHYFSLLDLPCLFWHRAQSFDQLYEKAAQASVVLLLICDQAIEPFIDQHLQDIQAVLVHCSGSLVSAKAFGAHPLMTFGKSLYVESIYRMIPFVIDQNFPTWQSVFPRLSNQHYRIKAEHKAKYHALCVLSGNFSCLLWQKLFHDLETELHLPAEIAHAYLIRQLENVLENPRTALTGPLVRQDQNTIASHLLALEGDPFKEVYQSFVNCYQQIKDTLWL